MKLKMVSSGEEVETDAVDIRGFLKNRGKNIVSHVVKLNGVPCAESEKLKEGDKLEIINILSGG